MLSKLKLIIEITVKLGNFNGENTNIYYVPENVRDGIKNGSIPTLGYNPDGSVIIDEKNYIQLRPPSTQWDIKSHDAGLNGSSFLNKIFKGSQFPYAKSYYAVYDAIRFFVDDKPDAVILDFFAGSGTTLHAVNLLNQQDNGRRKCIMVTSDENNIARDVMWPRTVCTIKGTDIDGKPLKGNYFDTIPMSDGFKSNAVFYSLKISNN